MRGKVIHFVIHSNDNEVIKQFALKKPVGRILVNNTCGFLKMGGTITNLFPSMTLGKCVIVGKGMTSDNVSPMNLVYIRKVGFEVRNEELLKSIGVNENIILDLEDTKKEESLDNVKLLKNI